MESAKFGPLEVVSIDKKTVTLRMNGRIHVLRAKDHLFINIPVYVTQEERK